MRPSASVPKPFVRRAVYPLKEAVLRRRTLAIAAELGQSERLSRDELLELQTERFGRILRHAYEHVPYYRRLFDSRGLSPEDIRSPADLPRLPILTKEIIRRHRDELTVSARPGPGTCGTRRASSRRSSAARRGREPASGSRRRRSRPPRHPRRRGCAARR